MNGNNLFLCEKCGFYLETPEKLPCFNKKLIKLFDCNKNIEFMNYELTTKRETKLENEILSNTMDAYIDAVERHKSIDMIYVVIDAVLSRCRSFSLKKNSINFYIKSGRF